MNSEWPGRMLPGQPVKDRAGQPSDRSEEAAGGGAHVTCVPETRGKLGHVAEGADRTALGHESPATQQPEDWGPPRWPRTV